MSKSMQTLELARIYERQGYYEDAFEIYSFLCMQKTDNQESFNEISAGLKRMEKKIKKKGHEVQGAYPEENISRLCEKWLTLMVLKHRFDKFKKVKSRLLQR
ncbi:hypothetical protein [Desulfobacula toluolica]|nr:hypothetical protein [Desulfobacula toluolica]